MLNTFHLPYRGPRPGARVPGAQWGAPERAAADASCRGHKGSGEGGWNLEPGRIWSLEESGALEVEIWSLEVGIWSLEV